MDYISEPLIRLFWDNKATCDHHTKHVEVDRFCIKKKLDRKVVELHKICLDDQLADMLTKVVSSRVYLKFLDKLDMCDIYAPT